MQKIALALTLALLSLSACATDGKTKTLSAVQTDTPDDALAARLAACHAAHAERDLIRLRQLCKPLAEDGHASAQFIWGSTVIIATYYGIEKQIDTSALAEHGLAMRPEGLDRAYAEGREWIEAAMEQDHEDARIFFAFMHYLGAGVDRDLDKSWMMLSSHTRPVIEERIHDTAMELKSGMEALQRTHGVSAIDAMRELADSDTARSEFGQMFLAIAYFFGVGVTPDHEQTLLWATRASEGGSVTMQTFLGALYLFGLGDVGEDYGAAMQWLHASATRGHSTSMVLLGHMYAFGLCTAADPLKAYMLYSQAAVNDPDAYRLMQFSQLGMSSEQQMVAELWEKQRMEGGAQSIAIPPIDDTAQLQMSCYKLKPVAE